MSDLSNIFSFFIPKVLGILDSIFANNIFLILVTLASFILKAYILHSLVRTNPKSSSLRINWVLLIIVLIAAMVEDLSWFVKIFRDLLMPSMDYRILRFIIRIAWALSPIRYNAFALFLENSTTNSCRLTLRQKIFLAITGTFFFFFILIAILDINCYAHSVRPLAEIIMIRLMPLYSHFIVMPISLYIVLKKLKVLNLPRILKRQIKILTQTLIIPTIIMDFLQSFPFDLCITSITWVTNSYTILGISNILLTYMTFYCARKMMGLRFLNISNHVQSPSRFNFIDNFKDILEQLGRATSMQELTFVTQDLFQKAFSIPARAVTLHTCTYSANHNNSTARHTIVATTIDMVINSTNSQWLDDIQQSNILIYDEIAFSNYYEQDNFTQHKLRFLDDIYADIFIPIFNQHKIIGCIIIERNARPQSLYGNFERDEMIVFASYLGNIINLLQNRNLEHLIAQEKEMREELYNKHQEINQYKESIRSFLKNKNQLKIGIIFYKNRQFVVANREAKELIPVNLNIHEGHPLTKACKRIVTDVQQYKSAQRCLANDGTGTEIVIYGMPHIENNQVTLVVYYPEATDLITKQIDQLKDPSQWDYLLYLETTETGKLVNRLIPGNGEQLLNFKINLLKTALSTKATLLDMPLEDLIPTAELLHHISLRNKLETIILEKPQTGPDLTITLFGLNPLFATQGNGQDPLLKKLDGTGTLFIRNIHFLNNETQQYLAEFIHYGYFKIYKTDQKIFSNVRIICSSSQSLEILVHENKFSPDLFKELQKTALVMPSLMTMEEEEIDKLADGFAEQALSDRTFEKILEFNDRDRKRIINSRPTSLQELKKTVQNALIYKSKNNNLSTENTFDPAYQVTDPELAEIARLGKHALKNEKAMTILWNKFKNQNKIATFLGVNRSSVNRRCKDYKLI